MLAAGTRFPDLELRCIDGSTLKLPDGLTSGPVPSERSESRGWSVVLFYRGHF